MASSDRSSDHGDTVVNATSVLLSRQPPPTGLPCGLCRRQRSNPNPVPSRHPGSYSKFLPTCNSCVGCRDYVKSCMRGTTLREATIILTIRAIMIGQQIDVVPGDFNGTAWRCSNRDNISTIDEASADCALPTPPGLHHCGDTDRFQTTGLTSVGSLSRPAQIGIGRYSCTECSPSHAKLSACVQPIKVAIMRHGSTWISSIGATPNHITKNLTDELCHFTKGRRRGGSVIL